MSPDLKQNLNGANSSPLGGCGFIDRKMKSVNALLFWTSKVAARRSSETTGPRLGGTNPFPTYRWTAWAANSEHPSLAASPGCPSRLMERVDGSHPRPEQAY